MHVIFGHDNETGNLFTAFGLTLFQAMVADRKSRPINMVIIDLRQSNDEFEQLLAAVREAKGYHEYIPSENPDRAEIESLETLFRLDPDELGPQPD
jgi:hypothetical protein